MSIRTWASSSHCYRHPMGQLFLAFRFARRRYCQTLKRTSRKNWLDRDCRRSADRAPASTSRMTPLWAAICAPLPISRWPVMPACAARTTWSPRRELEPECRPARRSRSLYQRTLCPIWTRLSILLPDPIMVSGPVPRSTVAIGADFDVVLDDHAAELRHVHVALLAIAKPKPRLPMRTPGCRLDARSR